MVGTVSDSRDDSTGFDYGITCPQCEGRSHLAVDRLDSGRDYVCVRCGCTVVVGADSI
jgi:hypothetical protein